MLCAVGQRQYFSLISKVTHKKASLRNEEYDFNMCDRLCKRIKLDNLVVNHIEMKQKACYWMELRNEETYVYIIPSGMWEGETEMHILVYEEKQRIQHAVKRKS